MAWFKKTKEQRIEKKVKIPEGLWVKCENCKEIVYKKEIEKNLKICPKCNYHFRISARERLKLIVDEGGITEIGADITSGDPLVFRDTLPYKDRIRESQNKSGLKEAIIAGEALISGYQVIVAVMDFSFLGGSMGSAVGEKIVRAAEAAIEKKVPLITVASSGGARMQEGIFFSHADGKGFFRNREAQGERGALYIYPLRSDFRRRYCELCHARGYHSCRAEELDRLCRPARDRTDHKAAATGEFSACGISS